jgi:hypothetical protein
MLCNNYTLFHLSQLLSGTKGNSIAHDGQDSSSAVRCELLKHYFSEMKIFPEKPFCKEKKRKNTMFHNLTWIT